MPKEVQYGSHQCVNESAFGKNFFQMESKVGQEEKGGYAETLAAQVVEKSLGFLWK